MNIIIINTIIIFLYQHQHNPTTRILQAESYRRSAGVKTTGENAEKFSEKNLTTNPKNKFWKKSKIKSEEKILTKILGDFYGFLRLLYLSNMINCISPKLLTLTVFCGLSAQRESLLVWNIVWKNQNNIKFTILSPFYKKHTQKHINRRFPAQITFCVKKVSIESKHCCGHTQ